jgi:hypothetical protein
MAARFVAMLVALTIEALLLLFSTWMLLAPCHYGGPMNLPDFRSLLMLPGSLTVLMLAIGLGIRTNAYRLVGTSLLAIAAFSVVTIGVRFAPLPSDDELDAANNFPPDAGSVWLALGAVMLVASIGLALRRRAPRRLPT